MKISSKLVFALVGLAFAVPCLAGGLAEYPTVGLNFEKYEVGAAGSSISAGYFSVDGEIPLSKGSALVGMKSGTNYGVSETIYKIGYRFEIK